MRGDRVGVGDIGEVHGGPGVNGHSTCDDDCWREIYEHEPGMVSRRGVHKRDAFDQPSRDGVVVSDGARGGTGTDGLDGDDSIGADGMRGDGVGVGDISEVPDRTGR